MNEKEATQELLNEGADLLRKTESKVQILSLSLEELQDSLIKGHAKMEILLKQSGMKINNAVVAKTCKSCD